LSYDTSIKNSYYSNSVTATFFELTLGLSMRSVNYTSRVLVYDDFLGNTVGYLSNLIIILYLFNSVYNAFGARVYFTEKFFMKNQSAQAKIVQGLRNKLERSGGNSSNPPQEINQIDVNPSYELKGVNQDGFIRYVGENSETMNKNKEGHGVEMMDIHIKENINASDNKNAINSASLNETTSHSKIVNQKNNFKYNFFEYIFYSYFCCMRNRKKQEVRQKSELLKNSESFLDYYLDVNTYVRKMIEIDMLKLFLLKDKEDFEVINNLTPVIKNDYAENYENKINSMYKNRTQLSETDELLENIRYMKSEDSRVYKALLAYYQ
jgi:hypothetical protein